MNGRGLLTRTAGSDELVVATTTILEPMTVVPFVELEVTAALRLNGTDSEAERVAVVEIEVVTALPLDRLDCEAELVSVTEREVFAILPLDESEYEAEGVAVVVVGRPTTVVVGGRSTTSREVVTVQQPHPQ